MAQLRHYNVKISPDPETSCAISIIVLSMSTDCSTWFIISMAFERFYSIIRPHKAASFNTVKRAKIIIACIVVISVLYSVPHLFMTDRDGTTCIVFAKGTDHFAGKLYFWSDQVFGFGFPFVALLLMNSVIIHTLCKRSTVLLKKSDTQAQGESKGNSEGHSSKMKNSEKQTIIMLLLVTFGFLILMSPSYAMTLHTVFVDFSSSPKLYAGFILFVSIGEKTFYTNFGINFYLYVISGSKFRSDLLRLFQNFCPQATSFSKHVSKHPKDYK